MYEYSEYIWIIIERIWSFLQKFNWRLWTRYGKGPLTLIPLILLFISVYLVGKYRQIKHSKKLREAVENGDFSKDKVFINSGGTIIALDKQNRKLFLSGIDGIKSLSGIHDISELNWSIEKRKKKKKHGKKVDKWSLEFEAKSSDLTYDIRFGEDKKSCKNCLDYLESLAN